MIVYIIYVMIKSFKWWKRSKKYVEEEMKKDDIVYVSNQQNLTGKVVEIKEDTVDILITVSKNRIYLNEKI